MIHHVATAWVLVVETDVTLESCPKKSILQLQWRTSLLGWICRMSLVKMTDAHTETVSWS